MNERYPTFSLSNESAEMLGNIMTIRCRASVIHNNTGSVDFTLIGLTQSEGGGHDRIRINRDSKSRIGNLVFREILRKRLYGEISRGFQILHDDSKPYPRIFCSIANELKKWTRRRKEFDVVATVDFGKAIRLGEKDARFASHEGWASVKERYGGATA